MKFPIKLAGALVSLLTGAGLGLLVLTGLSILAFGAGWYNRSQIEVGITLGPTAGAVIGLCLGMMKTSRALKLMGAALICGAVYGLGMALLLGGVPALDPTPLRLFLARGIALHSAFGACVGWWFDPSREWLAARIASRPVQLGHPSPQ